MSAISWAAPVSNSATPPAATVKRPRASMLSTSCLTTSWNPLFWTCLKPLYLPIDFKRTLFNKPFCFTTFLKPTDSKVPTIIPKGTATDNFSFSEIFAKSGSLNISSFTWSLTCVNILAVLWANPAAPGPPNMAGIDSVKPKYAPPQKPSFIKSLYSAVVDEEPNTSIGAVLKVSIVDPSLSSDMFLALASVEYLPPPGIFFKSYPPSSFKL